MQTLTPRQFLIQIQLKNLQCQPSTQISKAFCQLHYQEKYIKFKTHPQINPSGIANFKKQIVCIPYCNQISLVVRKNINSKKQIFLGHFTIDIEYFLKRRIYFIELNQKLCETQSYINFNLKLINKNDIAESETEDLSEQEELKLQKSQYSTFDNQDQLHHRIKNTIRDSQSQVNFTSIKVSKIRTGSPRNQSPFSNKKPSILTIQSYYDVLLPEQFNKKLFEVDQIIQKRKMVQNQFQKLVNFKRNNRGQLKSIKIQKLDQLLKTKKQELLFNNLMIYIVIGIVSFFIGLMISGQ